MSAKVAQSSHLAVAVYSPSKPCQADFDSMVNFQASASCRRKMPGRLFRASARRGISQAAQYFRLAQNAGGLCLARIEWRGSRGRQGLADFFCSPVEMMSVMLKPSGWPSAIFLRAERIASSAPSGTWFCHQFNRSL